MIKSETLKDITSSVNKKFRKHCFYTIWWTYRDIWQEREKTSFFFFIIKIVL